MDEMANNPTQSQADPNQPDVTGQASGVDDELIAEVWGEYLQADSLARINVRKAYHRQLYEASLYDFGQAAWSTIEPGRPFMPNWHIEALCEHLEAVESGQIKRLVINISPGSGKSIWLSVLWPCWSWARECSSRWLFASYASNYVLRDSRKRRELIRSKWFRTYWWEVVLKEDQSTAHRFENVRQGFMVATSSGSASTGEHANVLVFDDPHDRMDRYSKLNRETAINWYQTVFTSLNLGPDTRQIIVAQRITEDDMSGYVLAKELGYEHLCIPLFYDSRHPTATRTTSIGWKDPRTVDGEVMWPAMYPPETIDTLRKEKSSYDISAQYQQNPTQDEGAMFPRSSFCYFESDGEGDDETLTLHQRDGKKRYVKAAQCSWFQCADTALETSESSAWTVVGTFLITPQPASLLVYDIARERLPVPKQLDFLLSQRQRHPRVGAAQFVEKKASGHGIIQEGAIRGTPFGQLKPGDKNKDMRLVPACIQYENGMVYHRSAHQAPWLADFEHEIAGLPDTEWRDQGDVLGYAGIIFQRAWMQEQVGQQSLAYTPGMRGTTTESEDQKRAREEVGHELSLAEQLTGRRRGEAASHDYGWRDD